MWEEKSDDKDWRLTVEDEEQCDGIENALSDTKEEPPTSRQMIAL